MFKLAAISLSVILLILTCLAVFVFGLGYLELPPPLPPLPPNAYDETHLQQKERQLTLLVIKYDQVQGASEEVARKIQAITGDNLPPEDLAMLASWASTHEAFWDRQVYAQVFFDNVHRLGKMKDPRARFALWKLRQEVTRGGKFDAHIAEVLIEAEEMQKSN